MLIIMKQCASESGAGALTGSAQLRSSCAVFTAASSWSAGTTFWLLQNMLSGSHCCFTRRSRSRLLPNVSFEPACPLTELVYMLLQCGSTS